MRAYREILRTPGALAFSGTAAIGRFGGQMFGLGIILMIQGIYGSYGLAGAINSAVIAALACTTPILARLVDRYGQARIMRPSLAISISCLSCAIVLAVLRAPIWAIFPAAIGFGATLGNLRAMVGSRWNHALSDDSLLHTAFSWESVVDEATFLASPLLATWLATTVHPVAGVVACGVFLATGGFAFLAQRSTEPPARPAAANDGVTGVGVIALPGMLVVAGVMVCLGAIFTSWDLATIALFEEMGRKASVGIVFMIIAGGSLVGGLVYGAIQWRSALRTRFLVAVIGGAVGCGAFLFITHLWVFGVFCFLTGLAIAPIIINANSLAQRMVPKSALTEGLAWVGVAINVGAAIGSPVAGFVVDHTHARLGFAVTSLACIGAVVIAAAGLRKLPPG
ncbi:MAG: MFS transporter [Micrococcales bacterium]|nr:MFS transporter [Micrococcales bacterium]